MILLLVDIQNYLTCKVTGRKGSFIRLHPFRNAYQIHIIPLRIDFKIIQYLNISLQRMCSTSGLKIYYYVQFC